MADEKDNRASEEFKERLSPGGDIASPVMPEQLIDRVNEVKKNRWLAIFIQLARCERFLKFVEDNYSIVDKIDDEKKSIETTVYEHARAVGPGLGLAQRAKIFNLLKTYGCRHPEKVFADIMATLGQETDQPSLIASATDQDVKQAVADDNILKTVLE